jgi:hypothetical protein
MWVCCEPNLQVFRENLDLGSIMVRISEAVDANLVKVVG